MLGRLSQHRARLASATNRAMLPRHLAPVSHQQTRFHGGHGHSHAAEVPDDVRAQRITWIGLYSNVFLGVLKGGVGMWSGSSVLVADAIHSASDLVTDAVALVSVKVARQPKDETQPYGYGHYESLGTLMVSVLLVGAGIGTGYHSVEHLVELLSPTSAHSPLEHIPEAIACAALSVAVKEVLFQKTVKLGYSIPSPILVANAWHHRSDALSSVVALGGIGGAALGFPYLDPVGGLFVAGLIVKVGGETGWGAMQALTDRQTVHDRELVDKVVALGESLAVQTKNEIRDIHDVRLRRIGHYTLIDLHMCVNPHLSVTAAYQAGKRLEDALMTAYPNISEVFVHVEAGKVDGVSFASSSAQHRASLLDEENAQVPLSTAQAISRPQFEIEEDIEKALEQLKSEDIHELSHCHVHYLHRHEHKDGVDVERVLLRVEVNLVMERSLTLWQAEEAAKYAHDAILQIPYIDQVDVHLELLHHDGVERTKAPIESLI